MEFELKLALMFPFLGSNSKSLFYPNDSNINQYAQRFTWYRFDLAGNLCNAFHYQVVVSVFVYRTDFVPEKNIRI